MIDAQNQPLTRLGDFRSSQAYMTALGGTKTAVAVDYTYDDNGNLTKDRNKDISGLAADGITYNHLNLPWKVAVQNKGYIQYLYDAAGNKLQKIVRETGKPDKVTDYLAGTVYENDMLQYIGQEEGRMRLATQTTISGCGATGNQWLAFDYMLKDHLGNVRATLTDEWQQDNYPAAMMEVSDAATESLYYTKISDTYTPVSSIANYPATSSINQPNAAVAKLNKNSQPVGPGILLKVMAGDRINLQCDMWYRTNSATSDNSGSNVLAPLLLQLAGGVPSISGGHLEAGQTGSSGSFFTTPVTDFLNNQPAAPTGKPQAGVSWLLLDEQFGWQQGNGSGMEPVGDNEEYKHFVKGCGDAIEVQKSGYIYVYTSNQSNIDVFFDNLQVSMVHGPLLEETRYYPFGITMQDISSKAAGKLENSKKYNNGTELTTDLDLNAYETPFRQYDPQIGRFDQIDPMEEDYDDYTPYNYSVNNPVLLNDPTGLTAGFPDDEKKRAAHDTRMDATITAKRRLNTNFWLQNVNRAADGTYHIKAGANYSQRAMSFLQSRTDFQNKRLEFNNAIDGAVQEGLWMAVPWGRVVKGLAWAYKGAKALQAAKTLMTVARVSSLAGNVTSQLSTNGFSLGKLNITSALASFALPNNPTVASAIGSAGEITIDGGLNNTILTNKTYSKLVQETIARGVFGNLANKVGASKIFGQVYGSGWGGQYMIQTMGNNISNTIGVAYHGYEEFNK